MKQEINSPKAFKLYLNYKSFDNFFAALWALGSFSFDL